LQVLRDDHLERWTRGELERDIEPEAIQAALVRLEAEGVVVVEGEQVRVSRAPRRMDALGLVSV
jgi:hypothetical protein